ncbi:MAG TPA: sigma-70 family RNA polymerase sigma factor [Dehalococcoidia bacterium]|nr:sigma-70 family RNA polymerase sigma factor [Dehalococcoidia bacterium]
MIGEYRSQDEDTSASAGSETKKLAPALAQPEREQAERREVDKAKAGDPALWDRWFHAFYPRLFRYAYIRLRNRGEAEDIASQVFVEALRGIKSFEYTGRPVLAWLYRIEHNLISDRFRAEARRATIAGSSRDAIEYGVEGLAASIDLFNAIRSLPGDQRQVIILRYLMGLAAQDVSSIMGKTQTAVYSLQARALVNLRKHLSDEDRP